MLSLTDTILAQASAPGVSGKAIVRLAGPGAFAALEGLASKAPPRGRGWGGRVPSAGFSRRGVSACTLWLDSETSHELVPLPATVLAFPAPRSYTGDDVIEVVVPGNPHLVQRLLRACLAASTSDQPIRMAQPGEFTARAFLRGRLTLTQAEGVAATIAAASAEQLAGAKALLAGTTGEAYRAWADELTTLMALVEAGIDFTDQEDVVAIAPTALAARATALRDAIRSHLGAARARESSSALPRVVLAGAPNAGKSTLFNALLGRPRAVASPTVGTTRDVLAEELDLRRDAPGAGSVMICDVPGLDVPGTRGTTSSSASDAAAQVHALEAIRTADLVLWCEHLASPAPMLDALSLDPDRTLVVHTFADRSRVERRHQPGTNPRSAHAFIPVCGLDGWNLPELRRAIARHALATHSAGIASLLPRHREALVATLMSLDAGLAAFDPTRQALDAPEAVAHHLRAALTALGELVGQISPDDVIGRVFATFCVGK
jgi:tRNA modification GTPase